MTQSQTRHPLPPVGHDARMERAHAHDPEEICCPARTCGPVAGSARGCRGMQTGVRSLGRWAASADGDRSRLRPGLTGLCDIGSGHHVRRPSRRPWSARTRCLPGGHDHRIRPRRASGGACSIDRGAPIDRDGTWRWNPLSVEYGNRRPLRKVRIMCPRCRIRGGRGDCRRHPTADGIGRIGAPSRCGGRARARAQGDHVPTGNHAREFVGLDVVVGDRPDSARGGIPGRNVPILSPCEP